MTESEIGMSISGSWVMYYDGQCQTCRVIMIFLSKIDFFHRITWISYNDVNRIPDGITLEDLRKYVHLFNHKGEFASGFYAFRKLTSLIFLLWPLVGFLWIPGVDIVGIKVYKFIADNRACIPKNIKTGVW